MNPDFAAIIHAPDEDRLGLFLATSARLGTAVQNVEKDFWVCWTLDALFNGLRPGGPRLLFKGGTSLSKAFGLISRFSEDIDITVFRADLGHAVEVEVLEALGSKQRKLRLDHIRTACQDYIANTLIAQLQFLVNEHIGDGRCHIELDQADPDQQTILLRYPVVTNHDAYIRSAIKIEAGAKSALDPHTRAAVTPYIAPEMDGADLRVANITTVEPVRTLWDKIVILHGLRQWYERRDELRQGENRISRHYYDVFRLMQSPHAAAWIADRMLAEDCARHAHLFFGRPDPGLTTARCGSFTLSPAVGMLSRLERDFDAMLGMVFGDAPDFAEVLNVIAGLEHAVNS